MNLVLRAYSLRHFVTPPSGKEVCRAAPFLSSPHFEGKKMQGSGESSLREGAAAVGDWGECKPRSLILLLWTWYREDEQAFSEPGKLLASLSQAFLIPPLEVRGGWEGSRV